MTILADHPPSHIAPYSDRPWAIVLLLIGLVATIACGRVDPMGVVHADDLTHFLFAKWAWTWPTYLLNDWGRPGFTVFFAPAAAIGWGACRIQSALLTAATAWLAYLTARDMKVRGAWGVIPLFYLQPLVFQLAQTTLTETPLMFYLALAVFLAGRGKWAWSATALSAGLVTRHESIIFLPLWIVSARRARARWLSLLPVLWAPVLVNVFASILGVNSIMTRLFHPESSGQYGHGGWLTFFARSMEAWGPAVTVMAMAGIGAMMSRSRGALPGACVLAWFGTQTAIRALGLYDSGGYARFLVPVSPFVAIAALHGWNALPDSASSVRRRANWLVAGGMMLLWLAMERQLALFAAGRDEIAELPEIHYAKWAVRIAAGVIVALAMVLTVIWRNQMARSLMPTALIVLIGLSVYSLCGPLRHPEQVTRITEARQWLNEHQLGERPILSASVWIDYLTHRDLVPDHPTVRAQLSEAPLGTIFFWEAQFAGSPDHRLPLSEFTTSDSFRLLHEMRPLRYQSKPYLQLFEKIGPWHAPDPR